METEPLTPAERYLAVIGIMCQAMIDATEDPETHMSDSVAAKFAAEMAVADAMLGRPHV